VANGLAGADTLSGLAGNDLLNGNGDADVLDGGPGNDTLDGGAGVDTASYASATSGVTVAIAAGAQNTIGAGIDTLIAVENLTGSGFDDTLTGDGTANTLIGGGGIDNLSGLAGADRLEGGAGNDILNGGLGADTALGGIGDDTYFVDAAADSITELVGQGIDSVFSTSNSYNISADVENLTFVGTGNFVGIGSAVDNLMTGGSGDDSLDGNGANDVLLGLGGNDFLLGGGNTDQMFGGAGNDTIAGGGGGGDVAKFNGSLTNFSFDSTSVIGGVGTTATDILVIDQTGAEGTDRVVTTTEILDFNGVTYTVVAGTALANAGLNGAAGAAGSQAVFGFGGNDTINGGGGNDILHGGEGDDTITQAAGTGGRDIVDGGAGNDTYQLNGDATAETFRIYTRTEALAQITGLTLSANTEIVVTRNGTTNANVIAELDNIEEINVNTLLTTVNDGNGVVNGGVNGGDTIAVFGNFNAPETSLNFSTITIEGSAGNDTVDISQLTSEHRIVFNTEGGKDTVVGDLRPQDVINGALASGTGVTKEATISVPNNTITIPGATGEPSVTQSLTGTSKADVLFATDDDFIINAGKGNDKVTGGDGDDEIDGGSGKDILDGGAGDDNLNGGSGKDILRGGEGDDTLTGGSGKDTFFFGDEDTITDFKVKSDKIDLSEMGVAAADFGSKIKIVSDGNDALVKIGEQTMHLTGVSASSLSAKDFIFGQSGTSSTEQSASAKTSALVAVEKVAETAPSAHIEDSHLFSGQMFDLGSFGSMTLTPEMLQKLAPLSGNKVSVDHVVEQRSALEAHDASLGWLDDDFLHNLSPDVLNGHLF
jgi:Ca2+-binding RTX toxin-like protein